MMLDRQPRAYEASALRSQQRPIVLIAGGKNKGLDYSSLLSRLKKTTHDIIVFGEIADELATCFSALSPLVQVHVVSTLDEAVQQSFRLAKHGDTVLFSPGTSSFDQFSGYEERGDVFRKLVSELR